MNPESPKKKLLSPYLKERVTSASNEGKVKSYLSKQNFPYIKVLYQLSFFSKKMKKL